MNIFSCDTAQDGTRSLLEILQKEGHFVSAPCGGRGTCGKCVVRYRKNPTPPSGADMEKLTKEQIKSGFRLACQSYPEEPFEVELSEIEEQIQVEAGSYGQPRREKAESQAGQQPVSEKADTPETRYGIAIDIGSTTLAAVLINLNSGERLQTAASVNHQRADSGFECRKKMGDAAVYPAGFKAAFCRACKERGHTGRTGGKNRGGWKYDDVPSA